MAAVTLYGPTYSSYTRVARMALAEKNVDYDLVEVDYVFANQNRTAEHLARHPFGKMPVLEHDGFSVYETTAITRYVDEAFDGPALQLGDARGRAWMNQVISIVDAYVAPLWILDIFMPRVVAPILGQASDEARIASALEGARTTARVLDGFLESRAFCAGGTVSLADCFLYPQYVYAAMTDEIAAMLAGAPNLVRWAERMAERASTLATAYPELPG